MAFKVQQEEDENKPAEQPGMAPPEVAGGSASAPTAPAAAAPKPASSGRFTNIQKYLQANTGAGNKIAGQIGQKVGQQNEQFQKAVGETEGVKGQLEAERQRIAQAGQMAQQVQQDPTKLVQDPNQLQAFTQLRTGQTATPQIQQQAQNVLGTAQSQLGKVQELAGLTGTEGGRFELLRQALARPTYTRGQQRLDQLLLQTEGGQALGNLQRQTAEQAAAGQQAYTGAEQAINKGITDVGSQAKTAQEQLLKTLGVMDDPTTDVNEATGAMGNLQQQLQAQRKQVIEKSNQDVEALKQAAAKGEFTPDMLKQLGLGAGQGLYNVNLADYIKPSFAADAVTEQNVANPEQLARYQALAQLSGVSPDYLKQAQIGTAPQMDLGVNQQNLQAALQGAQNQYREAVKKTGLFNPDSVISAEQLQQAKQQYSGADWLNQYAQYLADTGQGHLHSDMRMGLARQEQARRLALLQPLIEMNPGRVIKQAGLTNQPKDDSSFFDVR